MSTTTTSVPEQLRALLKEIKARQVLPATWDLLHVNSTDTVGTAFHKMAEKNVYAVPVFDKSSNSFTGFLGLSDIVHQIVRFFVAKAKLAHPDLAKDVHKLLSASTFNQTDAENIHHKVFNHPLADLVNVSGTNGWNPVSDAASLQEVIDVLTKEKLSRVPLVNAEGHVTAIVSESAIVRYLAAHIDQFGDFAEAPLSAALKHSPLLDASDMEESTIACFAKLDSHKTSHLPLSSHGKSQGNLSVKDIKAADEFQRLIQPVGEFVAYIRQQNMKAVHPYMHANSTDAVGRTYGRFAATGVHTMYLTDMPHEELEKTSSYPPVGVVTLHDLLAPLASN